MVLTGKTKEDFMFWYYDNNYHHQVSVATSDDIFINALIIEWFDSVGVYINTIRNIDSTIYCRILFLDQAFYGKNRQEATEKAIIKANEIYNERDDKN